jgi:hypothetical protein
MLRRLLAPLMRSRCFSGCAPIDLEYTEIEQARKDTLGAIDLIQSQLQDYKRVQRVAELTLISCQQKLRVLVSNLESDAYPDLLVYRIKVQMKEKHDAEGELKLIIKMIRQLQIQLTSIRESELNTGVMCAMKSVLRCTTPQTRFATECADTLIDDINEQHDEVAETTRKLAGIAEEPHDIHHDETHYIHHDETHVVHDETIRNALQIAVVRTHDTVKQSICC